MKQVLSALLLLATSAFALGNTNESVVNETTIVTRKQLGTGSPAQTLTVGNQNANYVADGYYHVPQDLPYYPTAGIIWPRIVELECEKVKGELVCEGYHWQPKLGRGEYLFVVPRLKVIAPPVIAPLVIAPPVIIYKEVPYKKKAE